MAETPKSPTINNYFNILGIPKTASLNDICKAYKSLVMKWHPDKNSNKSEAEDKFHSITEAYRALSIKKRDETTQFVDEPNTPQSTSSSKKSKEEPKTPQSTSSNKSKDEPKTPQSASSSNKSKDEPKTPQSTSSSSKSKDDDDFVISNPTLLSRTGSHSYTPMGTPRTTSGRRNSTPTPLEFYASLSRCSSQNTSTPSSPATPVEGLSNFSRARSRRTISTPIIFSQSIARKKPPPIERKLECSLEELCHGSTKKIKITRDVISDFGLIIQEEEILKIRVKPGWKKGTKITFEGKGDERPGMLPADIIFVVDEKRHPLYKRIGDDLELGVEVPLVQALTGCNIDVPLLGGENMNVSIDDIIYPGFEHSIPGQGMMISKDGARGNLRLKFLVEFPTDLSDEQRSDAVSILNDCS